MTTQAAALAHFSNLPWRVEGCGNPQHGPGWTCYKVVDSTGARVLSSVSRDVAERYAALPKLAADNVELREKVRVLSESAESQAAAAGDAGLEEAALLAEAAARGVLAASVELGGVGEAVAPAISEGFAELAGVIRRRKRLGPDSAAPKGGE